MTLTISTFIQDTAPTAGTLTPSTKYPGILEVIGSTDQTVIYAGDTPMQVALPVVDGGTSGVSAGWTVTFDVQGSGSLEVVDRLGHRVSIVPGYGQGALVATDDVKLSGESTYGGWADAMQIPNLPIEDTTALTVAVSGSVSSDATPSVLRTRVLDHQTTVALTYLDDGVLGQVVTIKQSGGTNSTMCVITNAASFALKGGVNWTMSTGEELEMQMVSTDGWAEVGRRTADLGDQVAEVVLTASSACDAGTGSHFNISACASCIGTSGIIGGQVGQILTFHTTVAGTAGLHHSTAVGYIDLQNTLGAVTTAAVANHGASIMLAAGTFVQVQMDGDGVWKPTNDGLWLAS
jgi:hypothetical protein